MVGGYSIPDLRDVQHHDKWTPPHEGVWVCVAHVVGCVRERVKLLSLMVKRPGVWHTS